MWTSREKGLQSLHRRRRRWRARTNGIRVVAVADGGDVARSEMVAVGVGVAVAVGKSRAVGGCTLVAAVVFAVAVAMARKSAGGCGSAPFVWVVGNGVPECLRELWCGKRDGADGA